LRSLTSPGFVATGRRSTAYKPTRGRYIRKYRAWSPPRTSVSAKQNPGHYFVVSRTDHSILAKTWPIRNRRECWRPIASVAQQPFHHTTAWR